MAMKRTAQGLTASGCAEIALFFVLGAPLAQSAVSPDGEPKSAALRGIWESEAWAGVNESGRPPGGIQEVTAKSTLSMHPPYNEEWEAKYQAGAKDKAKLAAIGATMKVCSFAFPGAMESPSMFEIVVTPEQTLFVFMTPEVRHIYTDGRSHPAPR